MAPKLSAQKIDFITASTGNYIECAHGDDLQPYFEPIVAAVDEAIQNGKYSRILITACHAVGKTFTCARVGDAIMGSYDEVKLISTAPTYRQVHDLLWKEWASCYDKKPGELRRGRFNPGEPALWINSETFARGFSPQKKAKSEAGQGTDSDFQGYHGKFMTVIIFDEATGVPPSIWEQAEGLQTSGHRVLFIVIGNPTSRNCRFYHNSQSRLWKTFKITCFDSPNLQAANVNCLDDIQREVDIVNKLDDDEAMEYLAAYPMAVPYLINTRWVIEKAIEWGLDHPLFRGKVLGEFPHADSDVLISDQDVLNSWARPEIDLSKKTTGYIGLDVARFGVDKSVLTGFVDTQQVDRDSMAKQDTNQVVGRTLRFIERLKKAYHSVSKWRLAVDGGFGHGVIDNLNERQEDQSPDNKAALDTLKGVEILEINFGSTDWTLFHTGWKGETVSEQQKQTKEYKRKARLIQEDRENYANFKAKMFDLLARGIKSSLRLIKDDIYKKQLPTIRSDVDGKGRLAIESKKQYKERTGESSPDDSDSMALANFARYFAIKPLTMADALKKARSNQDGSKASSNPFYKRFVK